jgi:hypothetical protein
LRRAAASVRDGDLFSSPTSKARRDFCTSSATSTPTCWPSTVESCARPSAGTAVSTWTRRAMRFSSLSPARRTRWRPRATRRQSSKVGRVRVRIGVHTGEPMVTDEGYVGIDVHRAARIASSGHGGQVLVSQSTRDLVTIAALRDLGEHRLKDLWACGGFRSPRSWTLRRFCPQRRACSGRARLDPAFQHGDHVDEICSRLDDLPLALELAAARTSLLTTTQLLERLGSRLDLLRGGRDTELRQRTLRATIEWSSSLQASTRRAACSGPNSSCRSGRTSTWHSRGRSRRARSHSGSA